MRTFLISVLNHLIITTVLVVFVYLLGITVGAKLNFFTWDMGIRGLIIVFTSIAAIIIQAAMKDEAWV